MIKKYLVTLRRQFHDLNHGRSERRSCAHPITTPVDAMAKVTCFDRHIAQRVAAFKGQVSATSRSNAITGSVKTELKQNEGMPGNRGKTYVFAAGCRRMSDATTRRYRRIITDDVRAVKYCETSHVETRGRFAVYICCF
jgi:hypothetical protein